MFTAYFPLSSIYTIAYLDLAQAQCIYDYSCVYNYSLFSFIFWFLALLDTPLSSRCSPSFFSESQPLIFITCIALYFPYDFFLSSHDLFLVG